MDKIKILIEQLEEKANGHIKFSEDLFNVGDKINAQYHDGMGTGIKYVLKALKEDYLDKEK